jgi:arylsulfatase A-like enzyme
MEARRPDFLIFITDQLHPNCLGYAGHPVVQTPNLDKLASEGMNFTRMYTTQPLCMPARASMFTGLTPRGHKVRMNGINLDPEIPTFPEALRKAGYHTHCCGKIHLTVGGVTKQNIKPDPVTYPESRQLWIDGVTENLPSPYYGLETADFTGGCAYSTYGHYSQWLRKNYPEFVELFEKKMALVPPSPAVDLYNRNSFKWALPAEAHPAHYLGTKTIEFLQNRAAERQEGSGNGRPFMLMCSIQEPHPPFAPPKEYADMYDPSDVPPAIDSDPTFEGLPPHFKDMVVKPLTTSGNIGQPMNATSPYRDECAAHYYGLVSLFDHQVGRVMAALDESGLAENTVVIFTSDHGEALGDHGMWSKGPYHYDGVIRVPFLVRWPGKTTPGSKHQGVTSLLDLAPTILDIAGEPIPEEDYPETPEAPMGPPAWPGRSLTSVISGDDTDEESGTALVEMDEDYLDLKLRTLVTRKYRMTVYGNRDFGELYDLELDPEEIVNRWADPFYSEIRMQLTEQLVHKIIETDIRTPRQISRA